MKKIKRITVISLDYDNCGDYLFKQSMEEGCYQDALKSGKKKNLQHVIDAIRGALENFILAETKEADEVELLVGSIRQSRYQDRTMSQKNKTALCFEMYADLAEKNGWHFNKSLLADVMDEHLMPRTPPFIWGTAMGALKQVNGKYKYEQDDRADSLKNPSDSTKTRLLSIQIREMLDKYPPDKFELKFVFLDDNFDIVNRLTNHFKPKLFSSLYSALELKFAHCAFYALSKKYSKAPEDRAAIMSEAEKIIEVKLHSCKKAPVPQPISSMPGIFMSSMKGMLNRNYHYFYLVAGVLGGYLAFKYVGNLLKDHRLEIQEVPSEMPIRIK